MWNFVLNIIEWLIDKQGKPEYEDNESPVDYLKESIIAMQTDLHRQVKRLIGKVTHLYPDYGIIDDDIIFSKSILPEDFYIAVGDNVQVEAAREHESAGWMAEIISRNYFETLVEEDWDCPDKCFGDICSTYHISADLPYVNINQQLEDKERTRLIKDIAERRNKDEAILAELFADKHGVTITGSTDFGYLKMYDYRNITVEIRNNGDETQILVNHFMKASQIFQLGPLKLIELDISSSSKKLQESLPLTLLPGKSILVNVICYGKNLGKETRTITFEFTKFIIGRRFIVDIVAEDEESGQSVSYGKLDVFGRALASQQQLTEKRSYVVPGQHPKREHTKGSFHNRTPAYKVPENVKHCILNQQNILSIMPSLKEELNSTNYKSRFYSLLQLEEVQQEVEIRAFDLKETTLDEAGKYLALTVPGLAEGRPSIMVGDRVMVQASDTFLTSSPSFEGIVHLVKATNIYLMFSNAFHNEFKPEQKFDIIFVFNRSSFKRLHLGIDTVSKSNNNILFPTKIDKHPVQVALLEEKVESYMNKNGKICETFIKSDLFNQNLNLRQRHAVLQILLGYARPLPYIIYGPPGTGKTITVVEAILQIFKYLPNCKILACTPSNSAADLLTLHLHLSGIVPSQSMLRLNAVSRSETVMDSISQYCKSVNQDMDIKAKRIVICTCMTAGALYNLNNKKPIMFSHIFIDEAGQATEPEVMVAIGLMKTYDSQIVLAGDPKQLGPVLRSRRAQQYGLDISYLERLSLLPLYSKNDEEFSYNGGYNPLLLTKLVENYRSHKTLIYLPSLLFYSSELEYRANSDLTNCMTKWSELPNKENFPILFHGIRGEDIREMESPSWFNPKEAWQVIIYLKAILNSSNYNLSSDDIGIITPYRKQAEKIRSLIKSWNLPNVKVGSVEEFQGQERLVIIISTVRSNEDLIGYDLHYTLGFLGNAKRFNVSITRAHALMVIIGNPFVLQQDLYFNCLIRYCVLNGGYTGCDLPPMSVIGNNFIQNSKLKLENLPVYGEQSLMFIEMLNNTDSKIDFNEEYKETHINHDKYINEMQEADNKENEIDLSIIEPSSYIKPNPNDIISKTGNAITEAIISPEITPLKSNSSFQNWLNISKVSKNYIYAINKADLQINSSVHNSCDEISNFHISHELKIEKPKLEKIVSDYSTNEFVNFNDINYLNRLWDHSSDKDICLKDSLDQDIKKNNTDKSAIMDCKSSFNETILNTDNSSEVSSIEIARADDPSEIETVEMIEPQFQSSINTDQPASIENYLFDTIDVLSEPRNIYNNTNYSNSISENSPDLHDIYTVNSISDCSSEANFVAQNLIQENMNLNDNIIFSSSNINNIQNLISSETTYIPNILNTELNLNNKCETISNFNEHGFEQKQDYNFKDKLMNSTKEDKKFDGDILQQLDFRMSQSPSKFGGNDFARPLYGIGRGKRPKDVKENEPVKRIEYDEKEWGSELAANIKKINMSEKKYKIRKQIEYYFGDINLLHDNFLNEKIDQNEDGWVSMDLLLTFNRLKNLSEDPTFIINTLIEQIDENSVIQVEIDGCMVRRNPNRPIEKDLEKWKLKLVDCSIILFNYPLSTNLDKMELALGKFAKISHIERKIPCHCSYKPNRVQHVDLIIFESVDELRNFTNKRFTTIRDMGLSLTYKAESLLPCIEYFINRRILRVDYDKLKWVRLHTRSDDGSKNRSYDGKRKNPSMDYHAKRSHFDLNSKYSCLVEDSRQLEQTDVDGTVKQVLENDSSEAMVSLAESSNSLNEVDANKDYTSHKIGGFSIPQYLGFCQNENIELRGIGRGFIQKNQSVMDDKQKVSINITSLENYDIEEYEKMEEDEDVLFCDSE